MSFVPRSVPDQNPAHMSWSRVRRAAPRSPRIRRGRPAGCGRRRGASRRRLARAAIARSPRRSSSSWLAACSWARRAGPGSLRAPGSSSRCCSSSRSCRSPVCHAVSGPVLTVARARRSRPSSSRERVASRQGRVPAARVPRARRGRGAFAASGSGPQGDEPHYLMVAESLLRDGDLDLERDYAEGRYALFHDAPLLPHYRVRGEHGEIYSLHAIGLSRADPARLGPRGLRRCQRLHGPARGPARARGARVDGGADGARGRRRRGRLAPRALAAAPPLRGLVFTEVPAAPGGRLSACGAARAASARRGEAIAHRDAPSRRCPG